MSFDIRNDAVISATANAQTQTATLDLTQIDVLSLHAVYTAVSESTLKFTDGYVNTTTDTVKFTAGFGQSLSYPLGLVGQLTTTGTLPGGLALSTNYFIIPDSPADGYAGFATSLANAVAGTLVNITSASGGGTHTFTPTALSGILKVSHSNDPVAPSNWVDQPNTTVTITGTGSSLWSSNATYIASSVTTPQIDTSAKWARVLYTPTAGAVTLTVTARGKKSTQG